MERLNNIKSNNLQKCASCKKQAIIDKDAVNLPSFFSMRSIKQYCQNWYAYYFYPKCNPDSLQRIMDRLQFGGQVISSCQCGALRLVCEDVPRIVTVCHCSVCRYDEARAIGKDNAPAPFFAAVKRSNCRLEITNSDANNGGNKPILVYRNSSDFARRGMCSICQTYLIMDYEWFEPSTVWLQKPVWINPIKKNEEVKVEFAFNDGKADFDVCWPSRNDPCISLTCKVSYLDNDAAEKRDINAKTNDKEDIKPRGLLQFKDLDFSYFYNDSGML